MAKTELADRVQAVIDARGWSPYQWAKRAKLSGSTITNMISRRSKASEPETLRAMAEAAGVSLLWLEHGQGSMDDALQAQKITSPPTSPAALDFVSTPLADAIGDAFDRRGRNHAVDDMQAVLAVLGSTFRFENVADPVGEARAWLDAARNLRLRHAEVSVSALIQEVMYGRDPRARQLAAAQDAAADAEGDAGADELGLPRNNLAQRQADAAMIDTAPMEDVSKSGFRERATPRAEPVRRVK